MKSLKNLIIPAIALVVLIVGAVLWFTLRPQEETTEIEELAVTIVQYPIDSISSVKVDKKYDDSIGFSSSVDSNGAIQWNLLDASESDESMDLSNNSINVYVMAITNFTSTTVIAEPGELSEYGLEDPDYTITITDKNNEVSKIYVGNYTYDQQNCYVMKEGDTNVYTCIAIKRVYAGYSLIDFLSTQLLNIDYDNLASVTFDRKTDGICFTALCSIGESGSPVYDIVEPYSIRASAYFENLIEYIATLEITQFMELTDDQLPEYGLDEPAFTFTFNLRTGETIVIELSNNLGGNFYGRCSGVDNYFVINELQISGLETPLLTLLNSYVSYYSISEVSSIHGDYDGSSFDLEVDVENSINDTTSSCTLDGRNALITTSDGSRSYAAILFGSIACIEVGGVELDADPDYEPVMNITIVTNDYHTKSIDFVVRNSSSYYVFINGEYTYFYVYSDELFNDGGTDTYSYGVWPAYELLTTAIDNNINGFYDIPEV